MSHASGEVIHEGKVIAYFEYDGTSDICISVLYKTPEELQAGWRSGNWNDCTCGESGLRVILYSDYGGGFYWPGEVCMKCKAITKGRDPHRNDYADDGEDDWQDVTDGHPLRDTWLYKRTSEGIVRCEG